MSHSETYFEHHRRRRRKWAALAVALVVLVIGACVVFVSVALARALTFEQDVRGMQTALVARDFSAAGEALADARSSFGDIKSLWSVANVARPLPFVGTEIKTLDRVLKDTEGLLDVLGMLVSIGIDVETNVRAVGAVSNISDIDSFFTLEPDARRELVLALKRAAPELEEARVRLSGYRRDLASVAQTSRFPGVRTLIEQTTRTLIEIETTLNVAIPLMRILPVMGGFNEPQQYLLLLQNTGELRPTGGFWGTYGAMTVQNGEVAFLETDDIYAVDVLSIGNIDTEPPLPLKKYLGVDTWYMRDMNWSADVPTSVQNGLAAYAREIAFAPSPVQTGTISATDFDGAILVTPAVGKALLAALGPVKAGGLVFRSETFFDDLQHEVEVAYRDRDIASQDRKDVIGELLRTLLAGLLQSNPSEWGPYIDVAHEALKNQDIVLYHRDPAIQRLLEEQNWAGDVRVSAQSDHFMVVDANMAALKTDARLDRSYAYIVTPLMNGRYQASLRIDYDHNGGFDYRTTRYRTYTRVYVPEGSELVRVDGALKDDRLKNPNAEAGDVEVYSEFGARVFAAFTSVEPGASGSLTFHYLLPERIERQIEKGAYVLDVQRQIGVGRVPLSLNIDFGKQVMAAEPGEARAFWYDDTYTYSTTLDPFQSFQVWVQ
ncbi:hypothetical protein A3B32_02250 [Candidatus Uhrbacteria bacterium RIFCSPLOWO2_01_FULL_53_9]|uniref:DUF4012 domain-containing protein n=2 Tax=Candidatus Uhriibacteriota TaxID=1752732 RepID=A0A1F7UZN7_9BACT|nr:MAG: hypothetical protein A3C17_02580 [Candidatus Uhrbacteria bacterium RIFCSPHIGHO2_02_FULL_53_13]OGL83217.1 MAG: hypothetical protein A3B32_02250 [Candidatus Uhrbacteria bacterium RIFCSPLOWO2_01_FULL_53_9]